MSVVLCTSDRVHQICSEFRDLGLKALHRVAKLPNDVGLRCVLFDDQQRLSACESDASIRLITSAFAGTAVRFGTRTEILSRMPSGNRTINRSCRSLG